MVNKILSLWAGMRRKTMQTMTASVSRRPSFRVSSRRSQASPRLVMTVNKIVGPRLGRIVQFAPRRAAAPATSARRGSGVIFRFVTSRDPASSTILVVELSLSTPRRSTSEECTTDLLSILMSVLLWGASITSRIVKIFVFVHHKGIQKKQRDK